MPCNGDQEKQALGIFLILFIFPICVGRADTEWR